MGSTLIWSGVTAFLLIPLLIAANSPLLASREVVYIVGGLAGVVALSLLILQPLLAAGFLPGIPAARARRLHRWTGFVLVIAVALHIVGLYLTSPPDMIDALLLSAPTLYSIFGVIGMWFLLLILLLLAVRTRWRLRMTTWRIVHNALAVIVVITSVAHALMIEGAMGYLSKLVLSVGVLLATLVVTVQLRWPGKRA